MEGHRIGVRSFYIGGIALNYYVIELEGRKVVTAQSPHDKLSAMKRIAAMISPKAVVEQVDSVSFKRVEDLQEEPLVFEGT